MNSRVPATELRDVFLSHAAEDAERYVRPVAAELERLGISFWFDEAAMHWGDSISGRINDGLASSRFVVVFLSEHFLRKRWTNAELGAALSRENTTGEKVVLPLLVSAPEEVFGQVPLLRDKKYLSWSGNASVIAKALESVLRQNREAPPPEPSTTAYSPTAADLWALGEDPYLPYEISSEFLGRPVGRIPEDTALEVVRAKLRPELQEKLDAFSDWLRQAQGAIRTEIASEASSDGLLEIVSVRSHRDSFDVLVRNKANDACVITSLKALVVGDMGAISPKLEPSAAYALPLQDVKLGESTCVNVAHVVPPHGADRFLVDFRTTRVLEVRLSIQYNDRSSVAHTAWIWVAVPKK